MMFIYIHEVCYNKCTIIPIILLDSYIDYIRFIWIFIFTLMQVLFTEADEKKKEKKRKGVFLVLRKRIRIDSIL